MPSLRACVIFRPRPGTGHMAIFIALRCKAIKILRETKPPSGPMGSGRAFSYHLIKKYILELKNHRHVPIVCMEGLTQAVVRTGKEAPGFS